MTRKKLITALLSLDPLDKNCYRCWKELSEADLKPQWRIIDHFFGGTLEDPAGTQYCARCRLIINLPGFLGSLLMLLLMLICFAVLILMIKEFIEW